MNRDEVEKLDYGFYRVFWKSGITPSLAAVGGFANGDHWLAPCNWISFPSQENMPKVWAKVAYVEPVPARINGFTIEDWVAKYDIADQGRVASARLAGERLLDLLSWSATATDIVKLLSIEWPDGESFREVVTREIARLQSENESMLVELKSIKEDPNEK